MDSFDLKKFRTEKLKITQAQMAQAIGIRQDALSRYEDSPEDIPARVLLSICDKYGVTLDQMFDYQKETPCGIEIINNWSKMKYLRESVSEYLLSVIENTSSENVNILNEFLMSTNRLTTKPKVVLLGRSDSGQSTMINALLGENKLPTSWTPVTSIIVYIKHVEDRPEFITDELWVFGKDEQGRDWDDSRLRDKEYTASRKIAGGNAEL
ncbi:MAG: helix-turn-helix domain-containing protein, partial [Clostridia bacterium]|nr:helix-turn-helix domain-containing protein [Clostridia bacterium]